MLTVEHIPSILILGFKRSMLIGWLALGLIGSAVSGSCLIISVFMYNEARTESAIYAIAAVICGAIAVSIFRWITGKLIQ